MDLSCLNVSGQTTSFYLARAIKIPVIMFLCHNLEEIWRIFSASELLKIIGLFQDFVSMFHIKIFKIMA